MAWIYGNKYLSLAQMQNNALQFVSWCADNAPSWTGNAKCAMLGNFQQESTINPGVWQNLKPGSAGGGGWGLAQWTPWTKFTNWAEANGYADTDGDAQCLWIRDLTVPRGQWNIHTGYNITWEEFLTGNYELDYLTRAFCINWEQAGNAQMPNRLRYARYWEEWLGTDPDWPDPPLPPLPPGPGPLPWQRPNKMPLYMYRRII